MATKVMHGGINSDLQAGAQALRDGCASPIMNKPSSCSAEVSRFQSRRVTHPPAANLKPSTSPFPLPHMRHTSPANTRAVSQPAVKAIASLLPVPAVPAAQMASLRSPLTRRRSSSPPATSGIPAGGSDTDIGDLQACDLARFDDLTGLGRESDAIGSTGWPSDFAGWGGLLDLGDDDHRPNKGVTGMTLDGPLVSSPAAQPMYRARSDPVLDQRPHHPGFPDSNVRFPSSRAYPSFQAFSPDLIAHFGSDLAWKTILSSVVEVEGVGETSVARLLQEVWKRGGGDAVSAQCLWPSIIMSLSLPSSSATAAHVPFPSANAALSLQELYNLTLRHWEPSIFSGLLASYTSLNPTAASRHPYGAATPTREPDMSQWMNVSPGADLSGLLGGTGTTPRESLSHNMDFRFEPEARRSSTVRMDGDEQAKGIDEILAAMEEGKEAQERAIAQAVEENHPKDTKKRKSRSEEFQLPTPETDSSDSPSTRRPSESRKGTHSPEDMASPFVTASSATASTVSKIVPAVTRQPHPTSLMMPDATFVPPPPLCMFFNPAFKDLTQGKVGIWKGDLEVRGRGGGKFSILIVGEETTGHLWQSNLWSSTIAYPLEAFLNDSQGSCTSSMIPVSHLARDGFTPIAMGMVLCNDADVKPYVQMVQGLHAEGVAFHLPNPARLPLVFLPAKFDSSDPLQRLGIAFMSKPSIPTAVPRAGERKVEHKRKRRRQSAPAKTLSVGGHRKTESLGLENAMIEEEAVVD